MVNSQVTNTLAVVFWSLSRWKLALVWTEYLRVQPAGLNSALRRSVYALWSAYGITWPRRLPFTLPLLVLVTRHSMTEGSNGTSSRATNCVI
jgi:hypothetical protein